MVLWTLLMRVSLSPETVESLEDLTGKKITRNGDQVVQEVCEMAESEQSNNEEIDISVCSQTEKMTKDDKQWDSAPRLKD